ncbi:biopolymer transporter ExbD [Bacteroidales bacterium OttesenSCG-928-L03]|nr:biopolymer transporter ExbD [Bacteroidales bacterium OttesenSCG-928-L03]
MSRFRKKAAREVPAINTASLPDLIFTILFFFLMVTSMRSVPVMTQFDLPTATELQKLQEKELLLYVLVGHPFDEAGQSGSEWVVQLDDAFVSPDELTTKIRDKVDATPSSDRGSLTAVLSIDREAPMALVNRIKQSLKENGVRTVHYSLRKSSPQLQDKI